MGEAEEMVGRQRRFMHNLENNVCMHRKKNPNEAAQTKEGAQAILDTRHQFQKIVMLLSSSLPAQDQMSCS